MFRRYHPLITLFVTAVTLIIVISGVSSTRAAPHPPVAFRLIHPVFHKNYSGFNSTLQLNNLSAVTANAVIAFASSGNTYNEIRSIAANSALVIPASSLTGVPDGAYTLTISSDQPLESIAHAQRSTGEDPLAIDRGIGIFSTVLRFGPYLKGTYNSIIQLVNAGSTNATVVAAFYNPNGLVAYAQNSTVAPGAALVLNAAMLGGLPSGFGGWVQINSDQPLAGFIGQYRSASGLYDLEYYPEADNSSAVSARALARAFKAVDEGSGLRTTALFVINPNAAAANTVVSFYNSDGVLVHSLSSNIAAFGGTLIDLANIAQLSNGTYSVVLTGNQPVRLSGYTYHANAALRPVGDYETPIDTADVYLPYVASTDITHTVFSVQNFGASIAAITVSYYTNAGTFVHDQIVPNLAPAQAQRFDHRQLAGLPNGFTGYAIVRANGIPVQAVVDEYLAPLCQPASNVQIDQIPGGAIYAHSPVTFTATASGTLPFSYAWTLDGDPIGNGQNPLERVFAAIGNYTMGVTVTNACGAAHREKSVTVLPPPPDLSSSYKSVNLEQVSDGDQVTYTLVLRNNIAFAATATLTDPLPIHTTYIPASAQASSGVISYAAGEIRWHGSIIAGTPVILTFAAQIDGASLTPGTVITNTAYLNDGQGTLSTLQAHSVYNPGYRLSINGGALYTVIPTVTLGLTWGNETPPITQMQISNDGGFSNSTGWIGVNSTYAPWQLTTYGPQLLPRVVYARFRDGNGQIYGPIQDDVIYDAGAPQVTQITIITQTLTHRLANLSVIVRVTSSDDNSGVSAIHISHDANFTTYEQFPVTGATTDIPWLLQPSGQIYVRARDRAGNLSAGTGAEGPAHDEVYLPLMKR